MRVSTSHLRAHEYPTSPWVNASSRSRVCRWPPEDLHSSVIRTPDLSEYRWAGERLTTRTNLAREVENVLFIGIDFFQSASGFDTAFLP